MIKVPISNGELIDKITILQIKKEQIQDQEKETHITNELIELMPFLELFNMEKIEILFTELKEINKQLWDLEDKLRDKERNKMFDDDFIQLARKVYLTNDARSQVKLTINKITKSRLNEVKSYKNY